MYVSVNSRQRLRYTPGVIYTSSAYASERITLPVDFLLGSFIIPVKKRDMHYYI